MDHVTIAVSGIAGSFDDEAAQKYLANNQLNGDIFYAVTAERTFQTVMSGNATHGIVPLENSAGGMVNETLFAMANYVFTIKKVLQLDVQQNLMVLPGTKITDIESITSHPQALAQCRQFLKREFGSTPLKDYPDTALAAQDLRHGKLSSTVAVIASAQAAKLFELEILEAGIQDLKYNITSFLLFTK